eukprot:3840539-Prymnesium_polylepis.3
MAGRAGHLWHGTQRRKMIAVSLLQTKQRSSPAVLRLVETTAVTCESTCVLCMRFAHCTAAATTYPACARAQSGDGRSAQCAQCAMPGRVALADAVVCREIISFFYVCGCPIWDLLCAAAPV